MTRDVGSRVRYAIAGVVVAAQLVLVVTAYDAPHPVFGFQMFPEASEWQADIVRVTRSGEHIDVRDPWPGGYRWSELVQGRGLTHPFTRHHADAGLDSTIDFLDHALDWVAEHTPNDSETDRLEATVTVWFNDDPPRTLTLTSERRP